MKGIIICLSFIFAFNFYDYIKLCCIGRFHLVLVEHTWTTDRLKNIFIISFFVLHLFFLFNFLVAKLLHLSQTYLWKNQPAQVIENLLIFLSITVRQRSTEVRIRAEIKRTLSFLILEV